MIPQYLEQVSILCHFRFTMGNTFISKALKGDNRTYVLFFLPRVSHCFQLYVLGNVTSNIPPSGQKDGYTKKPSLALLKIFRLDQEENG